MHLDLNNCDVRYTNEKSNNKLLYKDIMKAVCSLKTTSR